MTIRADIKDYLAYDSTTGMFTWLKNTGKVSYAGKAAGTLQEGYVIIQFQHKLYRAHRLAFFYMDTPLLGVVDHIDGDRSNNAWSNLRDVSSLENAMNRARITEHPLGVAPCNRRDMRKSWQAYIDLHGKRKHLGYFHTRDEAITARKTAEQQYGYHPNHGRLPTAA